MARDIFLVSCWGSSHCMDTGIISYLSANIATSAIIFVITKSLPGQ